MYVPIKIWDWFLDYIYFLSNTCRSLFGGHTISITGEGFGTEIDIVSVSMGEVPCFVHSVNDTEILCTTTSVATSHYITNNAYVKYYHGNVSVYCLW